MKKVWILGTALLLALSGTGNAKDIIHNVQFSQKMPALEYDGAVARGDRDIFLLNANQGGNMTVHLSTLERNGCLKVTQLGGDLVGGSVEECENGFYWVGVLPKAGAYSIEVSPTRGGVQYKIEVSIGE